MLDLIKLNKLYFLMKISLYYYVIMSIDFFFRKHDSSQTQIQR